MVTFKRSPEAAARRALLRYLPGTHPEIVGIASPFRAKTVRALWADDVAFDIVALEGEWRVLAPSLAESSTKVNLAIDTDASEEEFAVAIAIQIVTWHRPIASFPPGFKRKRLHPRETGVAGSVVTLATSMDFLRAIADRDIRSTNAAVLKARFAREAFDDLVAESRFERRPALDLTRRYLSPGPRMRVEDPIVDRSTQEPPLPS